MSILPDKIVWVYSAGVRTLLLEKRIHQIKEEREVIIISVSQECDETVERWMARSRSKRKRCAVMSIHGVTDFFLKEERSDN